MIRKKLVKLISERLLRIRKSFGYNRPQMAAAMKSSVSSYYKNEKAKTSPDLTNYYSIAKVFKVSLDWLIAGRGEMFYQDPESKQVLSAGGEPGKQHALMDKDLRQDVKELLVHMEHIPMLRYEVLAMFQHFKANNKEMVVEALKDSALPK